MRGDVHPDTKQWTWGYLRVDMRRVLSTLHRYASPSTLNSLPRQSKATAGQSDNGPSHSDADIERVKRSTDLVALVQSRGVELKKHGSKDFIGRCPFTPTRKNRIHCHAGQRLVHRMACGKSRNAIQFVEQHDGVSFRHAFELLNQGGNAAFTATPLQKQTTVPASPCPLDPQADDATLFAQVVAYYHERLKNLPRTSARAHPRSRQPG